MNISINNSSYLKNNYYPNRDNRKKVPVFSGSNTDNYVAPFTGEPLIDIPIIGAAGGAVIAMALVSLTVPAGGEPVLKFVKIGAIAGGVFGVAAGIVEKFSGSNKSDKKY